MSDSDDGFGSQDQSCVEIEEESSLAQVEDDVSDEDEEEKNPDEPAKKKILSEDQKVKMKQDLDTNYPDKALSKDEEHLVDCIVKFIYATVAPTGHSGSVNIPKALDYLGYGKHTGFPKIDEKNSGADVDKYLTSENIDKNDKEQELSFTQGKYYVAKFWDKDVIEKLGKKLKKDQEKKSQKFFLINVGTSHNTPSEEDGADDEYDPALTHKDIDNKIDEIKQKIRWKVGYSLSEYGAPKDKRVKDTWTKAGLSKFLKKAFDQAFQIDPKPARTILYYSGQADNEGQWLCSDGALTLAEVLDLAVKADLEGHLEIHSDSNYSGKLCQHAKEWCDVYYKEVREANLVIQEQNEGKEKKDKEPLEDKDVVRSVQVISNTHVDSECEKGEHGKMYLNSKSEKLVKSQREAMKKKYNQTYGKTKFDSTKDDLTKKTKQIQEAVPLETFKNK